jgi:hypothetical protein
MTTTVLADGAYDGLHLDPGDSNRLMLMMDGDSAVFALNGDHIGTLDVSAIPESGDVKIGTGFWAGDEVTGRSTPYQNFTIWPLDR